MKEQVIGLFDKFKKNKNILDSDIINEIAEEGNKLYQSEKVSEALDKYMQGYNLIPEPKNVYSESSWFEVAIGDIYFDNQDYNKALLYYQKAKSNITGEGITNPYILFKYGASAYKLNMKSDANENLLRAYMLSGRDIFDDYDNEYFEFLKHNNKDIK